MNLTPDSTAGALPPPMAPTPKRHRWPWIVAAVGATLALGAIALAVNDDNDLEGTIREQLGTADAGTGDSSVELQIVDMLWESPAGKAAICPSFNDLKASMPTMSEDKLLDMAIALADSNDDVTPAQTDRLRELVLADC